MIENHHLMEQHPGLKDIMKQLEYNQNKRLLLIVPESAGDIFLSTSLLPSIASNYPGFDIYFSCMPQYFDILKNNPYVKKVLNYLPVMEWQELMEGTGDFQGLFDISIMATILTQRRTNYLNNGLTKIMFDIKK